MGERKVVIKFQTISGQWAEVEVPESQAEAEADRIRSLPDVKSDTVKIER